MQATKEQRVFCLCFVGPAGRSHYQELAVTGVDKATGTGWVANDTMFELLCPFLDGSPLGECLLYVKGEPPPTNPFS
jgi:hypothetical protein